jgi:hypothetical protein
MSGQASFVQLFAQLRHLELSAIEQQLLNDFSKGKHSSCLVFDKKEEAQSRFSEWSRMFSTEFTVKTYQNKKCRGGCDGWGCSCPESWIVEIVFHSVPFSRVEWKALN